jgi:hypothetical protein
MTRVLKHTQQGTTPVVYAITPASDPKAFYCTGIMWEATVRGGWTCVAGVARDNAGNLGISKPIRVRYDINGQVATGPAPECTDGCTMPEIFTAQGMPLVITRR